MPCVRHGASELIGGREREGGGKLRQDEFGLGLRWELFAPLVYPLQLIEK